MFGSLIENIRILNVVKKIILCNFSKIICKNYIILFKNMFGFFFFLVNILKRVWIVSLKMKNVIVIKVLPNTFFFSFSILIKWKMSDKKSQIASGSKLLTMWIEWLGWHLLSDYNSFLNKWTGFWVFWEICRVHCSWLHSCDHTWLGLKFLPLQPGVAFECILHLFSCNKMIVPAVRKWNWYVSQIPLSSVVTQFFLFFFHTYKYGFKSTCAYVGKSFF